MSKRPAFTLSDLLVIVAIIGLFIAVLFPTFSRLRMASSRVYCTNNLREQWTGLKSFADLNGNLLPFGPKMTMGGSLEDQPNGFIGAIIGGNVSVGEKQFYCPNMGIDPVAMDHGWAGDTHYRATGYVYLNDRIGSAPRSGMTPGVPLPPGFSYFRKLESPNGDAELAFDAIVTPDAVAPYRFNNVIRGAIPVYTGETTAHLLPNSGTPDGQNVLYLSGTVEWRAFSDAPGSYNLIGPGGIAHNPAYWWLQNP